MAASLVEVWIHAVFGTKYRLPLINDSIEKEVHEKIRENFKELKIKVEEIGGMPDHIHILFLAKSTISIGDTMQRIKGSTSHYINQNQLAEYKFAFQKGFGAFGVSHDRVRGVKGYICNQKEHHKSESYQEEYEKFLIANGRTLMEANNGWEIIPAEFQKKIKAGRIHF